MITAPLLSMLVVPAAYLLVVRWRLRLRGGNVPTVVAALPAVQGRIG
jgi:hypothetical protein